MANTTIRGALSIHGTNPQVSSTPFPSTTHSSTHPRAAFSSTSSRRSFDLASTTHLTGVSHPRDTFHRRVPPSSPSTVAAEEHCFALNSASLIDNALALNYIGGTYANQKPTEFMCLALKLLQLQPEREIILEYLRADEFKCVLLQLGSSQPVTGAWKLTRSRTVQVPTSISSVLCTVNV